MEAEKQTPWVRVGILFGIVAVVSVFSILKGKNSGKSLVGVVACGGAWWALTWIPFILLLVTSGGVVFFLIDAERVRQELGYHHIVRRNSCPEIISSHGLCRKGILLGR